MIDSLQILRIKRFQNLNVPLGRLTVLSGTNGGGKTTVIHSLLLARLAVERDEIDLGNVFGQRLGEATDLLNVSFEPEHGIGIILNFDSSEKIAFEFGISKHRTQILPVHGPQDQAVIPPAFAGRKITYLCADRLGPQDVYETVAIDSTSRIGSRGEQVAQILAEDRRMAFEPPLSHPMAGRGASNSLRLQTEAWLSTIVRPTEVQATWFANAGVAALRFRQPEFLGEWVRPINAGFGLTAAIPIVVAGLTMQSSDLLVVENPEAHLHPKGQSEIGSFLARVAASGAQVVVETHSDHVLNGIRKAVAIDRTISAQDVRVHFFDSVIEANAEQPRMTTVSIAMNGEMESWPEAFFDQMEKDLGALAGARRRKS